MDFLDDILGPPPSTSKIPQDEDEPEQSRLATTEENMQDMKEPEQLPKVPKPTPKEHTPDSQPAAQDEEKQVAERSQTETTAPKSAIEKVTDSPMVEQLVSGNLTPENAQKCREVIGCSPINLMSKEVQAALFKYNPSLEEAFDFKENGWTKAFVVGINESSNKMCSSIITAAIARSQLRLVLSSMGQNTKGRAEMVQFAQDLQSIFLDLAERTQNFVLVMAKTIGKMGQASFALKYGANPDVLVRSIAKVLEPMGADIEHADRVHAVAVDEILKMQKFIQQSMLSDDSRFTTLENEKENAGKRLQEAQLAVVTVQKKRIDTLVESKGTISRAAAEIEACNGHIAALEQANLAADARIQELKHQIETYRGVERELDRLVYQRQPHPPEADWGAIMERTLLRNTIDPKAVQARLLARQNQEVSALKKKFAKLGTVQAQLATYQEEKVVEVTADTNLVAERVEAKTFVPEDVPSVTLEQVAAVIDENALRQTLREELQNEIVHRTKSIEDNIQRVKDEIEVLRELERQLARDGAKASDGRRVETTTSGWWLWKQTYTKVVQGYDEKEAVRKMQQMAQEDIRTRRNKLDELSQQLASVQTDVQNDLREVHRQREEFARQSNEDAKNATDERNRKNQRAAEDTRKERTDQAERINADRLKAAGEENRQNIDQVEAIIRQRQLDAEAANKERKEAVHKRNQERRKMTEEINRKRIEQAERINSCRREQEARHRDMLMESHRRALETALEQARKNNHQVTEDAKNLVAKMQEHHRKICESIDQFNAAAEKRFNDDKMARLERIDGQKDYLYQMIESAKDKKTEIANEIRWNRQDIAAAREKLESSQQNLLALEDGGDIAKEIDDALAAEVKANEEFDAAAAAFEKFAKEFDQRTGAQFTSMMRMVRFLDESISNLPMAMKALDGVFREAMATFGSNSFRETMESIPNDEERRQALRGIARNLQDVSEIGWKMFDAPLKSLMRKEAFDALAQATVEMVERERLLQMGTAPAIEVSNGPIIEEVVEEDEVPARVAREMLAILSEPGDE